MNPPGDLTSAFLPAPQQELLLRAAILRDDPAREAWARWTTAGGFDALDSASERLLPLLYRNLLRAGIDDPRLRAVYRRTWCTNELLFRAVSPLLGKLHDTGIETMLLKGAALTLLAYRDQGVRPMDDIDVLVPRTQAPDAVRLMLENGWTPERPLPARVTDAYLSAWHEELFRDSSNLGVDLHWQLLLDSARSVDADREVWDAAARVKLDDGTPTSTPAASDLLFHVCVHGARWSGMPPIRWIADTLALLDNPAQAIDWNRVLRQAAMRRLSLPLCDALSYLVRAFQAPVPVHVLDELRACPRSRLERAEYRLWLRGAPALGLTGMTLLYAMRYARFTEGSSAWHRLVSLPDYLRQVWRVERLGPMLRIGVRKSVGRLRR